MLAATLQRTDASDEGTFGQLRWGAGSGDFVHTLELPDRDNARGRSCIPAGEYECVWHQSPSKGWCYSVLDVPGRSHILIHAANFAGDESLGWESELLGCIAPGQRRGVLRNKFGSVQRAVLDSRAGLNRLADAMGRQPFTLSVRDIA